MKPHFLILFLLLCPHKGAAEGNSREQKTPLFPEDLQKPINPEAFFSPTTSYEILQNLGIGTNKKLSCPRLCAQDLILNNAQVDTLCYDAQRACIRWAITAHQTSDNSLRRFLYLETEAYLRSCVLAIEAVGKGGSIIGEMENAGFFEEKTEDPGRSVTSNPE